MRIIDSPGVVFDDNEYDDGKGSKKGSVLLRNVVKVEDVEDPIAVGWNTRPKFCSSANLVRLEPTEDSLLFNASSHPSFVDPIDGCFYSEWRGCTCYCPWGRERWPGSDPDGVVKPFELEGLFGAADAGAFGSRDNDDVPMVADEDGDIFWDAVEDLMDEDGIPMESDDLKHIIPRKRSRSPSQAPANPFPNSPSNMAVVDNTDLSRYTRQPKRARKSKVIPAYDAPPDSHVLQQMGKSNPLGRKALKKDAKQARKAHRTRTQNAGGSGGRMEVDDEGLQFTFMA